MTQDKHPSGAPWRNFYGRFKGKGLRDSQQIYLDEDLAALSPGPVDWEANPERTPLDLQGLFGVKDIWLEIGFGGGEHMVHMAAQNPQIGLIGCEPYINGVAMLLGKIRNAGVTNVAVHPGDARDLFDVLPPESISKVFLNYPDPWPQGVMKPGAELRVATDIKDYVRQTLEEVPKAGFVWTAEAADDWRNPWDDWLSTRYEQKALREGRTPHYLTFRRV